MRTIRLTGSTVRRCLYVLFALAVATEASAERRETDLSRGWRFQFGVEAAEPQSPNFDDSSWQSVAIPHTWNRVGEYRLERTSATNNSQGVGWYRLNFRAPQLREGQRHYLEFDGVGNYARVWVNGQRVGEHGGAFSRFRVDVTEHLRSGENLISVSADNSPASRASIIPLAGDFFIHGGIYRGVRLISVDDAHIDLEDYGGPGIYARATEVTRDAATISVLIRLENESAAVRNLAVSTSISDARGRIVARNESSVALDAGARSEAHQSLRIASPQLWNGRANPYLYAVTVELREGRRVLDRVTQPLGVRTFRFDAEEGFYLNNEHLQLVGASRHQDRQGRGWALTREDHAEDMRIMLEMGANTVRHAHYQHAQEWAEEADRAGLVVWAEVPYTTLASMSNGPPTEAVVQNARQQTIELIRQNYNHPSIFMWSVGNEVDVRGRGMSPEALAYARALLEQLNMLAHEEDASRPTVYADCCEREPTSAPAPLSMNGVTDLIGLNRYYGWYYGGVDDLGAAADRIHSRYPDTPISISEFGAGGAFTQHTDNPEGGIIASRGRPHPEEFESWYHERNWAQLRDRRYIFAHWIWNMFDFSSNIRLEGDAIDINNKGLVSYDRGQRKDAFYFYQANWSDTPVLHITSRRYVNRAYPVLDVRAYSNAESATLTLNGVDIGETMCPDRICVWRNVRLAAGENVVRAQARINNHWLRDEVRWIAPDANNGLRIDSGELVGHEGSVGRFGSDDFFAGGTPSLLNAVAQNFAPVAQASAGPASRIVQGHADLALFNAYRQGDFSYQLPLPDGTWRVRLLTFEPDTEAAATRTFNVSINGRAVLNNFNPAQEAGGALRAVEREFSATAANGAGVNLAFQSVGGPAIVAAIIVSR